MKNLCFILMILLIAGCTSQTNLGSDTTGNNLAETPGQETITQGNENPQTFSISDSELKTALTELPFLSSANPAPESTGFPVSAMLILYFVNESGYLGVPFSLYERSSGTRVSLDSSTFDSFTNFDIGLKPIGSDGIIALNPDSEYVIKIEKDGENYYYSFTTGPADTTPPLAESVHFEGNDLAIVFSERVKSSTLNSANIVMTRGESVMTGDFANLRTTASPSYEDKKFFISYSGLTPGDYTVTISNIKDAAGNIIEPVTQTITK